MRNHLEHYRKPYQRPQNKSPKSKEAPAETQSILYGNAKEILQESKGNPTHVDTKLKRKPYQLPYAILQQSMGEPQQIIGNLPKSAEIPYQHQRKRIFKSKALPTTI